jgi:hypothetical protein
LSLPLLLSLEHHSLHLSWMFLFLFQMSSCRSENKRYCLHLLSHVLFRFKIDKILMLTETKWWSVHANLVNCASHNTNQWNNQYWIFCDSKTNIPTREKPSCTRSILHFWHARLFPPSQNTYTNTKYPQNTNGEWQWHINFCIQFTCTCQKKNCPLKSMSNIRVTHTPGTFLSNNKNKGTCNYMSSKSSNLQLKLYFLTETVLHLSPGELYSVFFILQA